VKVDHGLRFSCLVPSARLELAQLSPLPPQDSVSTNFTTTAQHQKLYLKGLSHPLENPRFRGVPAGRPGTERTALIWVLKMALLVAQAPGRRAAPVPPPAQWPPEYQTWPQEQQALAQRQVLPAP
jgi:hypothetical protein